MISLKIDENNNLQFADNFILAEGIEALKQDARNKISMWKGEYPYNINEGIDYLEILKTGNKNLFIAELRQALLSDDRILNVDITIGKVHHGKVTIELAITTQKGEMINV